MITILTVLWALLAVTHGLVQGADHQRASTWYDLNLTQFNHNTMMTAHRDALLLDG